LDNSAQVLVIVLAVFLALFLILAIILLIMLLRIASQIKKIADVAGNAAEQFNSTFGSIARLSGPAVASVAAKFAIKQVKKMLKKRRQDRNSP
jgi:hypothetical protein